MKSLIVTFVLLLASTVYGQSDKIPVKVTISANESFHAEVESYIKRELRALGDVEIVNETRLLKRLDRPLIFRSLSISMIKVKNTGGDFKGYAASIMYSVYYDIYILSSDAVKRDMDRNEMSRISEQYPTHFVSISDKDLKGFCEKIVADFDTEVLEDVRNAVQRLKKRLKN